MKTEPKKDWSFSEWINNFLEDPHPYYHSDEDDLVDPSDPMPGGDDWVDEIDESIIESLIILGLAGALAFLVYYRQQRQNNYRRNNHRERQQVPQQNVPRQNVPEQNVPEQEPAPDPPGQQPDVGFFPQPGDANYGQWVAGH